MGRKCKDSAPVGTNVIKRTFVQRNEYNYPTEVIGKIVAYLGHIGADFHYYRVKFEKPIYSHTNDLVQEIAEYDLVFPNGQSESEQAAIILQISCPCLTCSGYCACKIEGHHDK